jgi:hypothetical protein
VKRKQAAVAKTKARPAKAAARKAGAPRKKAAPKRGGGPTTAANQTADSEWAIGPYGDLVSKKDFAPIATRTRVS